MFSLVRSASKALLLEGHDANALKNYLSEHFGAMDYTFDYAFEKAAEDYTILFLTEQLKDVVEVKDIIYAMVIPEEPDVFLCELINQRQTGLLNKIRTAPRIIMVRAMGDMESVLQEIHRDHGGSIGTVKEIINTRNEKGTIVALTDKPLHQSMRFKDMYDKCLFVEQRYSPLFKSLRLHALKYLNKGIGNRDWYEIEIRIYDRYSAYKLQYERLAQVFDMLELGIILGESWTKDYPRPMMSVGVYRLRFFTFHDPKYIKKLLLGLEYLDDGTRIVDYDVYYQRKKMDWTDALEKGEPRVRHLLGLKYREEIFSRLNPQEIERIKQREEEILKTRY